MYYSYWFAFLMRILTVSMSESLTLVHALGILIFHSGYYFQLSPDSFHLILSIICNIQLLSFRRCFFYNERQKESGSGSEGSRGELGGKEEEKAIILI